MTDLDAIKYVERWRERQDVRAEEQSRMDRAAADLILGQGVIMGVSGVGLAWPDGTPDDVIDEARSVARAIIGRTES